LYWSKNDYPRWACVWFSFCSLAGTQLPPTISLGSCLISASLQCANENNNS
jgi:hypothetical protein